MATIIQLEKDKSEEEITKLLQSYIQSGNINFLIGSGASKPAINTTGSIESEIDKLLADDEPAANIKTLDFIELIDAVNASLADDSANTEVKDTLTQYHDFLTVVDRMLFERKNVLLPRQANVFTTNYDMFLEHASNQVPSLVLNDGFDRTASLSPEFSFAPERYSDRTYRSGAVYDHLAELPTINLIKLHGSLSWAKQAGAIVFSASSQAPLTQEERADSAQVTDRLKQYFLVLPNLRKFHDTLMDRVYYDLLRIYANSLDRENALLLCFGFSFADEHILDITRRALRNPTSQLIIFSYTSEEADGYAQSFSKQRNATVIAPPTDSNMDFSRLNSLLRLVLPA